MKLSDYVADFVARLGVNHVFMVPGGGSMHLVDSFGKNQKLEYVATIHEQGGALAAEAYAEYRNHFGFMMVTSGPGGTNAVTGVATAWVEGSGTFFLSGQAKRADMIGTRGVRSMGHQEIDVVSVVKPITKYAVSVLDPNSIRYHLEKAAYLALNGRPGPVWVEIPLDIQIAQIDPEKLVGFEPDNSEQSAASSIRTAAAKTISYILASERPVLLVGNGVRSARAVDIFQKVLEKVRIPVLLTWKAIDILPDGHPLYRGRPGGIGQRGANFTQQNSDCIIVIGARLDLPSLAFDHQGFARAARKIMVDVDPMEIRKMQMKIDLPICSDAGVFLKELLQQADALANYYPAAWLQRTEDYKIKYPVVLPEYHNTKSGFVSSYVFNDILSEEALATDVITTGGAGACSDILMQTWKVKAGQRIYNVPGIGCMGSGVPAALGGCLASSGNRTICVDGDGGFPMNVQELEVIRRMNLPVKFFVLNNDGYGSIRSMQKNHFAGHLVAADSKSNFTLPNVRRIAEAFCIQSDFLDDTSKIRETIRRVLETDGPIICEVMVSPGEAIAPRVSTVMNAAGKLTSKPMEDMSPLLPRDEFLQNMVIPSLED